MSIAKDFWVSCILSELWFLCPQSIRSTKTAKENIVFASELVNGRIVAVGEAYEQHASCLKGIRSVQNNCNSEIEDLTIESKKIPNPKYQIYYDDQNKFRFRLKAKNGEIIAQGEGYDTKEGCLNGIDALRNSGDVEIEDSTTIPESAEASNQFRCNIRIPQLLS